MTPCLSSLRACSLGASLALSLGVAASRPLISLPRLPRTSTLCSAPSAITLSQLASSTGTATFEKLISKTLLISYGLLTAPTTILLVLAAIWIDGLQHPDADGMGRVGGLVWFAAGGNGTGGA